MRPRSSRSRPRRWRASSSRRPARPRDRCRSPGRRSLSSTASPVERRRLLARTPVLLVGRDHSGEDVLIGPVLAHARRLVLLRPTLLLTDLADEGLALELFEADRASRARLRRDIVRLESEGAIENGPQRAAANLCSLFVPVGSALQDPAFKDLATLERSIDEGEFGDEHLAAAVLAARQHAVLADSTGADVKDERCDGVARDQLHGIARRRGFGVVIGGTHLSISSFKLSGLLG